MKRIQIYLSKPQIKLLDKLSNKKDISRSELIRRMLDKSLKKETINYDNDN
jgi:metal-responsive CopG/Arc/MetJ family transcriptional regulator